MFVVSIMSFHGSIPASSFDRRPLASSPSGVFRSAQVAVNRGLKKGIKRGKYKKARGSVKQKILATTDSAKGWKSVTKNFGKNTNTAYGRLKEHRRENDVESNPRENERYDKNDFWWCQNLIKGDN